MTIEQNIWGFTPEGEAVVLYTMTVASGASVRLTNVGAAIVGVTVPDHNGVMADVALGYADFKSYFGDGPCMGKSVGRFANRIARGIFSLDGKEYHLAQNNGPNHLHGGPNGFANRLWDSRVEGDRVVFSLLSPDGEENYPGELGAEVVYDWNDAHELEISLYARARAKTIVNLTNHSYFNLAGENSGSVLGQSLRLNASRYLPTDSTQIPTGEFAPVAGTPMDFTSAKELGRDINADFEPLRIGNGYDHCWAVDGYESDKLAIVGELSDPVSGRRMTIRSTQPGVQIYTGNYLQGSPESKSGRGYDNRDGVAIECQNFPDAPNHSNFPSPVLNPGDTYFQKIIYTFGLS